VPIHLNLILQSDAVRVKEKQTGTNAAQSLQSQPTHYSNLIRYIPSDIYFARVRASGKLIRKSLHADILSGWREFLPVQFAAESFLSEEGLPETGWQNKVASVKRDKLKTGCVLEHSL
jgi:hypothetical protein